MSRRAAPEDLIDTQGVADLLGLAQRNTVALYRRRYPELPQPWATFNHGRCQIWLRSEIEAWARESGRLKSP